MNWDEWDGFVDAVDKMQGTAFEELIAWGISMAGWRGVKVTPKTLDYGADILGYSFDGQLAVLEAKRWVKPVSAEPVVKLTEALKRYRATRTILVTNNCVGPLGRDLANEYGVIIWARAEVYKLLGAAMLSVTLTDRREILAYAQAHRQLPPGVHRLPYEHDPFSFWINKDNKFLEDALPPLWDPSDRCEVSAANRLLKTQLLCNYDISVSY